MQVEELKKTLVVRVAEQENVPRQGLMNEANEEVDEDGQLQDQSMSLESRNKHELELLLDELTRKERR